MPAPTLSVPTPCPESWSHMTPTTAGRHCAACQTVVVDFTGFSDAELLAYLSRHANQATCGRFRAGQLGRPLRSVTAASAGVARWRAWLAAAVAVWGLREVGAPAARAQAPVEQREARRAGRVSAPVASELTDTLVVKGVVVDSVSHEPLPGVTILLTGTQIGVWSDADGKFELALPPAAVTMQQKLAVSFIGYETHQVELSPASSQPLHVVLTPHVLDESSGVVVVVAGGARVYYPWYSPRGLWQRLTRPFQPR